MAKSSHLDRVIAWMCEQQKKMPIFLMAVRGARDVTPVTGLAKTEDRIIKIRDATEDRIEEMEKFCVVFGFTPPVFYLAKQDGSMREGCFENTAASSKELYSEGAMARFEEVEKLLNKKDFAALAKDSLLSKKQWKRIATELAALPAKEKKISLAEKQIDEMKSYLSGKQADLETLTKKLSVYMKRIKKYDGKSDDAEKLEKSKVAAKKVKEVIAVVSAAIKTATSELEQLEQQVPTHPIPGVQFGDPFNADVLVTDIFYRVTRKGNKFKSRYNRLNQKLQNQLILSLQNLNNEEYKPEKYAKALSEINDLSVGKQSIRISKEQSRTFNADSNQLFYCKADDVFSSFPKLPIRNLIEGNVKLTEDLKKERNKPAEKKKKQQQQQQKKSKKTDVEDEQESEADSDDSSIASSLDDKFDSLMEKYSKPFAEAEANQKKRKREDPKQADEENEKEKKKKKKKNTKSEEAKPAQEPVKPMKKRGRKSSQGDQPTAKQSKKKTEDTAKSQKGKAAPIRDDPDNQSFESFYEEVLEHYGFENYSDLVVKPENSDQTDALETATVSLEHEEFLSAFHDPYPKLLDMQSRDDCDSALEGAASTSNGSPVHVNPRTLISSAYITTHANRIPRSVANSSIRDNSKVLEEEYEDAVIEYLSDNLSTSSVAIIVGKLHNSLQIMESYYGNLDQAPEFSPIPA